MKLITVHFLFSETFTEMVLPSEYNLLQLCCNLGNVSGTQELHNPRSNLDFMAGFSECVRHVSAQLTSMTALHPELQPIQKKLSAHIHQVFKNKFLGLNDFFTQGILFDSSQQDYGSKTGFVKHSTSHLNSDESESVYNVESVSDSLPPMSKSPCTRVKHHKSKGFRPYRSNTSQTKEAAQKDRVNEIQPTHSKPSTQTITRAFDVCSVVGEQSIPRHSRVTSFSEPEQSYSSSSYEDLNAASAAVCPRHLIREEVIRAKSLNTLPRFQEASCAVPDCIRSSTFEEHLGRLSSWQNFNQLSMHKHIVPHHSPQSSKPAWFILPSVYPSCLGHGAQPTFPTTVGSLRPLQMTLSLPSPPSFGSYYS